MRYSLIIVILFLTGCTQKQANYKAGQQVEINQLMDQYVPYDMTFDASTMTEPDKTILKKLVKASAYIDSIYWLQTSRYGMYLRDSLANIKNDPLAEKLLTLVVRNAGPFEQLNDYESFMGNQAYYQGDELYPRGMTAEQFDNYIEKLPADQQQKFMSPYTVIREDGNGGYQAIPYHEEYKHYLTPVVEILNECADLTDNASFAKFLRLKAQALTTDNYYDADVAWIDLKDNTLDMVFGPFETYSDGIKGVKAKYEASIEIVDQEQSKKLDIYIKYLPELEENLPVADVYKSVVHDITARFTVVQDVIRKGETAVGYQAVATNLPNDPEVQEKKGSVKTFWKNMMKARFNAIIKPVSAKIIDQSQLPFLSPDGFFQFVLMHEICHAIGPQSVKTGPNKGMAVNAAIGPDYNQLEECKADVAGLLSLAYLIDKGVVDESQEKSFYVSYMGSLFRSIRFGLAEAHAAACAIALNYLYKNDGIKFDAATQRWSVNFANFRPVIKSLVREIVILEGDGDAAKVQTFVDTWAKIIPEVQHSLDKVQSLPIDVLPNYSIKWN